MMQDYSPVIPPLAMFWAAETPSARRISTTLPNTCEGGVGGGATFYNIPIPMPALRQQ